MYRCVECSVITVMPDLVAVVHSQRWAGGERGWGLCVYVCVLEEGRWDGDESRRQLTRQALMSARSGSD